MKALLTIDDYPSKNTPAIVDYLNEKGIKIIFFAVGKYIQEYPENAIYGLQHGMIVGNHSFSHPHFSELSLEECIKEIEENERILNDLYQKAGVERKYRPFRFPYGDKGGSNKEALQKYLADHGFDKVSDLRIQYPFWKAQGLDKDIDTLWTYDFEEYSIRPGSGFTKEDCWNKIKDPHPPYGAALIEEGCQHILLTHAHDETDELYPGYYREFVDFMLERGMEFVEPEFIGR